MSTHRHWVFTYNNPTAPIEWPAHVKYAVYQREVGESGTAHFQGYVEFTNPVRLSGVRKILPTAHWEERRGTREEARAYATKEATRVEGPFEHGKFLGGGRGTRNDLSALKTAICDGVPERDIFETYTLEYLKYQRAIEKARSLYSKQRTEPPEVWCLVGHTGVGKTRWVNEREPQLYYKQQSKWWCGYEGHAAIILDDFKGWIPFTELLRVLDRYPLMLETKGGQRPLLATRVYITSNFHPAYWYKNKPYLPALYRRITHLIWVDEDGEHTTVTPDELLQMDLPMADSGEPLDPPMSPLT